MVQRQMGLQPNEFVPVKYVNEQEKQMQTFVFNLLFGLVGIGALYSIFKGRNGNVGKKTGKAAKKSNKQDGGWFGGGGNMMGNMSKSTATTYGEDKKIDTRFKDVAGNENAKEEVLEFVDFLKNPKKYQALGARVPRGALLVGPPGTGKTLLAKAVAGEAGVPFVSTSGSEFVEMFVGVGASRVRDLFKTAREKAPSIVFIDEIDAVGKKRGGKMGGGNEERDNTLNQLLVEMDGFSTDSSVIVLAATNRADSLDDALKRPGRFDRQIEITLPSIKEREQIFGVHLRKVKCDPVLGKTEYARKLAALTPGFSGADIMNICNEGAIIAARRNGEEVTIRDFEQATERVIAGIERKMPQSQLERRTVAYHEAGHAVAGWFSEYASPLIKLTIIPRAKGSLGFAQYLPDEVTLYTQQQLEDMIVVALGGRIAEELFFGKITTGASDDLKKCTQIASGLVTQYGMSPRLGTLNYAQEQGYQKNFSEKTNKIIDDEISRVINECYSKSKTLLAEKREIIEKLAEELLQRETLSLPEIVDILGPRPFPLKESLNDYLQELRDRQQVENEMKEEEEKAEAEKKERDAAVLDFDPDAEEAADEEAAEEKTEKSEANSETEKGESKSEDDK
jgi:AFG3 family protein